MTRLIAMVLALLGLALAPTGALAAPKGELVSASTSDHLMLFGLLYSPERPSRSVVIHLPGGPGAFASPQDMGPLATALNAKGYNFLTINLRSAGANGILFTKFEDYLADVRAAVALAKSRGMTRIVLLAHSLSGPRAFYYLAHDPEPDIRAVVLSGVITSPYEESRLRFTPEERSRYDAFLQAQRDAVKAGDGRRLASFPWAGGRRFEMSAGTWVNIFGTPAESDASTLKWAKAVTVPVLIVHGTQDEASKPANADLVLASLINSPSKSIVWVEGANHLFIGSALKYAQIVSDWVVKTAPPEPAG